MTREPITFRVAPETKRRFFSKLALRGQKAQDILENFVQDFLAKEEDPMSTSPYKVKKTKSGWLVTNSPEQHWQGSRVEQKHLYKPDTLKKFGIDYEEGPYAPANEYGTTNIEIIWERAQPDKILSHGHIVE